MFPSYYPTYERIKAIKEISDKAITIVVQRLNNDMKRLDPYRWDVQRYRRDVADWATSERQQAARSAEGARTEVAPTFHYRSVCDYACGQLKQIEAAGQRRDAWRNQ
jgi:hypothetical protein